jgi:hypothetical protein
MRHVTLGLLTLGSSFLIAAVYLQDRRTNG